VSHTNEKIARRRDEEANRQKWKCFWCPTVMTPVPSDAHLGKQPDTMVTLDHVFNKKDPRRRVPANGKQYYVAACNACNQRRGREALSGFEGAPA
jgi:hypothetical protein